MKQQDNETSTTLQFYENHTDSLIKRYESAEISVLQKRLLLEFIGKENILEIGSGSGRDAAFLYKHGLAITAIDGSQNMVRRAHKKHPEITFLHHVLPTPLPFEKQSFEGVYAIAILMHLNYSSLEKSLDEIYRVLRKDSTFLLSVPLARNDIDSKGMDAKGRFFLTLSIEEWVSILQKAKYSIKNVEFSKDGLGRSAIEWVSITCLKN